MAFNNGYEVRCYGAAYCKITVGTHYMAPMRGAMVLTLAANHLNGFSGFWFA